MVEPGNKEGFSMSKTRKIIAIDEAKCTGCGQCILACAEGALALVNGKAKLVGDIYCDGIGACLGECPEGALNLIERPAEDFDEAAVKARAHGPTAPPQPATLPCGCPSTAMISLRKPHNATCAPDAASELIHFPIKLQLLSPQAPFLQEADLVLLADCAAVAYPNLHRDILRDKAVAIGCPKLDDLEAHIERLAAILQGARPRTLTVVHMEVPCCGAFMHAAAEAIRRAGVDIPLKRMVIGRNGTVVLAE